MVVTELICDKVDDKYRFGYNGKEKDNEWAGIGNSLDYGARIEDTRIGRFRSIDPWTYKFPSLTPYQFASNTPIRAVDLDGLEAAAINYGYRVTALIVTGSVNVGATIDYTGNVKMYSQWSAGVALGVFAGGGATVSFYPTATTEQIMGGGMSFGGNIGIPGVSAGIDLNLSPQYNNSNNLKGLKLGISGGVKPGSIGPGGAEVHMDFSNTEPFLEFNINNIPKDVNNRLQAKVDLTNEQTNNFMSYLAIAANKLREFKGGKKNSTENDTHISKQGVTNKTTSGNKHNYYTHEIH